MFSLCHLHYVWTTLLWHLSHSFIDDITSGYETAFQTYCRDDKCLLNDDLMAHMFPWTRFPRLLLLPLNCQWWSYITKHCKLTAYISCCVSYGKLLLPILSNVSWVTKYLTRYLRKKWAMLMLLLKWLENERSNLHFVSCFSFFSLLTSSSRTGYFFHDTLDLIHNLEHDKGNHELVIHHTFVSTLLIMSSNSNEQRDHALIDMSIIFGNLFLTSTGLDKCYSRCFY